MPPPLPVSPLTRVSRIAAVDGGALLVLAGGFALLSISMHDWLGTVTGALAAGAGAVELFGRKRLKANDLNGVNWLIRSQLYLLVVLLLYCAYQFLRYDPQPLIALLDQQLAFIQRVSGLEPTPLTTYLGISATQLSDMVHTTARICYATVAGASILCQGGLAYYYHRKRPALEQALRKT